MRALYGIIIGVVLAIAVIGIAILNYYISDEREFESNNTPGQLRGILGSCACQERIITNPDTIERCPQPFIDWQNSTHYIDNDICTFLDLDEDSYEVTEPDPVSSNAKSWQVLIMSLENDFDFDSLSSKEKRRNLIYAQEISVNENELSQFPSILKAMKDIGKYDSFPNKGYSKIDESERRELKKFTMDKSEEQTGIEGSSYHAIKLDGNRYHISYNSYYYPSDRIFLYVYPMEPSDTTDIFVEITPKDFEFIPLIGDALTKEKSISDTTNTPIKISVKDQKSYQDYLDAKFEEKYGNDTAAFGINHILFVDENTKERFVVQFEEAY